MKVHIPNLFSFGMLALGFSSLEATLSGHFDWCLRYLLLAAFCDLAASTFALRLRVKSEFGKELDSLATLATFGIAPLIFAYQVSLRFLRPWGLVAVCLAAAACALRLSRDNQKTPEIREHQGLPLTMFGLGLALLVSLGLSPWPVLMSLGALAFLSLSPWGYGRVPRGQAFQGGIVLMLLVTAWALTPWSKILLFLLGGSYILFGHLPAFKRIRIFAQAPRTTGSRPSEVI
jgi:CDP-diacylglycerol--serine O-phosphatidyltransferase